ncbi:ABC transporter permease [Clostridium sp. D2Q-11]|uniref:ABC transporter permease n=1 Tax=Anaeromonas frigoriresistens TaxID=2683708 RepID=A0A942UUR6_9FIRM|nr:ABC transporter permease [Anaeromonas frigoriresistens]MBS4539478.1 ABC transporter permease [Anaeromonas frigoriresistens]
MQVFKTYHKIIKRKFLSIAILLVAYLGLSLLYSHSDLTSDVNSFTDIEVEIAFLNEDMTNENNTELVEGMKSYLSQHAEIVTVVDNREDIQNALFSNEIQAAIRIPYGFTKKFFKDNSLTIEQMSKPDSLEAFYVQSHINKFLNKAKIYASYMDEDDQAQIVERVKDDLSKYINVEVHGDSNVLLEVTRNMINHYNFLGLYLLFSIVSGVGMSMMVFNKPEIIKRNNISSLSISNRNFQLFLGNISYVLFCWGLGMLISIVFFRHQFSLPKTILFSINALCFAITCLSIGFLIGKNVRNKNTFNSLVAIIILSMTFIGGLFIPLELMSSKIIKVAQFTPIYWYIKANDNIQNLDIVSSDYLIPIGWQILTVCAFGIGIFAFTFIISKVKYSRFHSQ